MYNHLRWGLRQIAKLGVVWWWSNKLTQTIWWVVQYPLEGPEWIPLLQIHSTLLGQVWPRSLQLQIQWEATTLHQTLIINRRLNRRRNNSIRKTWNIWLIQIKRATMKKGRLGSQLRRLFQEETLQARVIDHPLQMVKAKGRFSTDQQLTRMRDQASVCPTIIRRSNHLSRPHFITNRSPNLQVEQLRLRMDIHPNKTAQTWVISRGIPAAGVNTQVRMDHLTHNHLLLQQLNQQNQAVK